MKAKEDDVLRMGLKEHCVGSVVKGKMLVRADDAEGACVCAW